MQDRAVWEVLETAVKMWGNHEGQLTETEVEQALTMIPKLRQVWELANPAEGAEGWGATTLAEDWLADLQRRAKADCVAWDELASALGVDLDAPRWTLAGTRAVGWARPMGPSRKARSRCESGGRDYCSCDLCF